MTMFRKVFICSVGLTLAVAAGCGGSTDNGTGPGQDAGTGDDASSGTDGSMLGDGATGDTGSAGDSGSIGTVGCGMGVTCDVTTQVCCVSVAEGGIAAACTAKGACAGGSIACESKANCTGGEICCGSTGTGGSMIGSACATGPCGMGELQLCAMSSECPMGDTCRQSGVLNACRPPRPDGGMRDGGRPDGGSADAADGG